MNSSRLSEVNETEANVFRPEEKTDVDGFDNL